MSSAVYDYADELREAISKTPLYGPDGAKLNERGRAAHMRRIHETMVPGLHHTARGIGGLGAAATPAVGAAMQTPDVGPKNVKQAIPFRRATVERNDTMPQLSFTMTNSLQTSLVDIQGDGFFFEMLQEVIATTSGNTANVAFNEDAPFNAVNNPVIKDVNGEVINLADGFELLLADLAMRNYATTYAAQNSANYTAITGTGATGGSFSFMESFPIATNRRDLLGILGNQDRAQKYSVRSNLAPGSTVYATAPTTLPAVVYNRYYENYSVPLAQAPDGSPQVQTPPTYGVMHLLTSSVDPVLPAAGSKNHYLQRIGNTIRFVILVFRAGGSSTPRATADGYMNAASGPATITFKVGSDTLFYETYRTRRWKMFNRYGFEFPAGVLVYDTIHDFLPHAGGELGNDWYHTAGLSNAQFLITYPSTFTANSANSLTVITDDLIGI